MAEKYIKASECEKYFYEHLDDVHIVGAMNAIDEMPNADVIPVVRCKDCIYRGQEECAMFYRCDCGEQLNWETDNDFCSYGERRIDNG